MKSQAQFMTSLINACLEDVVRDGLHISNLRNRLMTAIRCLEKDLQTLRSLDKLLVRGYL